MDERVEEQIVEEIFSHSEAYENLQVLADDIGSRVAGSAGEVAARDCLEEPLERDRTLSPRLPPWVEGW